MNSFNYTEIGTMSPQMFQEELENIITKNKVDFIDKSLSAFDSAFFNSYFKINSNIYNKDSIHKNLDVFLLNQQETIQFWINTQESFRVAEKLNLFLNYASLPSFQSFIFNESVFLYAFGNALSGSHRIVPFKESDMEKLEWLINKKEYFSECNNTSFNLEMAIVLEKIDNTKNLRVNENSIWNKYSAQEIVENEDMRKSYLCPQNIDSFLESFFYKKVDGDIKRWCQSPNFLNDSSFGERLSFLSKSELIINKVNIDDLFNLYHKIDNVYEKSIWAGIILELNWINSVKNIKEKDATLLFNDLTKDINNSHELISFFNNSKNVWHTVFVSSNDKQEYLNNEFIESFMKNFIEKEVKASLKPIQSPIKGFRF